MTKSTAKKYTDVLVKRFTSKEDYVSSFEVDNLLELFKAEHENTIKAALKLLMQDVPDTYGKLPDFKLIKSCIGQAKANYIKSGQQKGYCPCCAGSGWISFLHTVGRYVGHEVCYRCDCSRNPEGYERDYRRDGFNKCDNSMCQNPKHKTRIEVRAGAGAQTKRELQKCSFKPVITELAPTMDNGHNVGNLINQIL